MKLSGIVSAIKTLQRSGWGISLHCPLLPELSPGFPAPSSGSISWLLLPSSPAAGGISPSALRDGFGTAEPSDVSAAHHPLLLPFLRALVEISYVLSKCINSRTHPSSGVRGWIWDGDKRIIRFQQINVNYLPAFFFPFQKIVTAI